VKLRLIEQMSDEAANQTSEKTLALLQNICVDLGVADWLVDLVLIDDGRMRSLNRNYRQQPGVTDVLSFTYLSDNGRGTAALCAGLNGACTDLWCDAFTAEPDTDFVAGEVVLAPVYVSYCCRQNGWSLTAELALLTVHGILHILGWDHMDPAQQSAMRAEEARLLMKQGIEHPLRERG